MQKELYDKTDLFPVNSHSFANISNVTIQVFADAQKDR